MKLLLLQHFYHSMANANQGKSGRKSRKEFLSMTNLETHSRHTGSRFLASSTKLTSPYCNSTRRNSGCWEYIQYHPDTIQYKCIRWKAIHPQLRHRHTAIWKKYCRCCPAILSVGLAQGLYIATTWIEVRTHNSYRPSSLSGGTMCSRCWEDLRPSGHLVLHRPGDLKEMTHASIGWDSTDLVLQVRKSPLVTVTIPVSWALFIPR